MPRSLFLGDLSAQPQGMLLRSGHLRGEYDLVKAAHHGSADPGLPALLERLDSGPKLLAAAQSAPAHLRHVPRRPGPIADAMVRWVAFESALYRGAPG